MKKRVTGKDLEKKILADLQSFDNRITGFTMGNKKIVKESSITKKDLQELKKK
jgi:hypothetical protein